MIRRRANGSYYCDGRYCGYPLAWFSADPVDGDPGMWVCLDCNASMYAATEQRPPVIDNMGEVRL